MVHTGHRRVRLRVGSGDVDAEGRVFEIADPIGYDAGRTHRHQDVPGAAGLFHAAFWR